MPKRVRNVLRIVFVAMGFLFAMLAVGTLSLLAQLGAPGGQSYSSTLAIALIYLLIAVASFFAVWRLRQPKAVARGFEVISKPTDDSEVAH